MRKIKDRRTIRLIDEIINSAPMGRGIPISNLTSQLFANIYLGKFDHFVKEDLRTRHYIRYVDDFVILDDSKKVLHDIKEKIREFLKDALKLTLHPKKQTIFPARLGIDFLGYRVWPTHRLLRKNSVRRMRLKLKKFQRLYREASDCSCPIYRAGLIEKASQSIASWLGHARHADTYNLRKKLFRRFVI